MEKLIAISDLFGISLDELMLGRGKGGNMAGALKERMLTAPNRQKAQKIGKILLILFGIILAADIVSMIIYFTVYGVPS